MENKIIHKVIGSEMGVELISLIYTLSRDWYSKNIIN